MNTVNRFLPRYFSAGKLKFLSGMFLIGVCLRWGFQVSSSKDVAVTWKIYEIESGTALSLYSGS